MQFKFKHSKINFSANPKTLSGLIVQLEFKDQIKKLHQKMVQKNHLVIVDDLTNGEIIFGDNTLLVNLGDEQKYSIAVMDIVATKLANYITKSNIKEINLHFSPTVAQSLGLKYEEFIEKFLVSFGNGLYYLDDFKTEKHKLHLTKVNIVSEIDLKKTLSDVVSILEGYFLVRDLANNPANVATPSHLGDIAKNFAKLNPNVTATILNEKEIKKLGMAAFLGVSKGSVEEPRFIQLEYKGGKKSAKPVILVGKGITFDSGGISLKPGANMEAMKYDMCGAATVLGVFRAVAKLELPVNLIVLVPTCENMPSGNAQKPGDIVKSMSGKTIEIINTDAEGRLILCDALHYAKQFNPEWVVDVATLTGACVVALGSVASGLYVNDEELYSKIYNASVVTNDKVWRMPLFDEYKPMIKSVYADLVNLSNWTGKAASVTAAVFLQEFVDYKWAHLDVAGTAMPDSTSGSTDRGGSGRPYKLLLELVRNHVK